MEIFNNSVWKIEIFEGVKPGLYRVIKIFDEISCLVIFYLENNQGLSRPTAIDLKKFNLGIKQKVISKGEFKLPPHLFFSEEEVNKSHLLKRDENYKLIKSIANDSDFIFDYATKSRVPTLAIYAKEKGKDRKSIARLLDTFWRFGQDKNALLPAYQYSGGSGNQKVVEF